MAFIANFYIHGIMILERDNIIKEEGTMKRIKAKKLSMQDRIEIEDIANFENLLEDNALENERILRALNAKVPKAPDYDKAGGWFYDTWR